ncbi:MAG: metal-binding protein [Spirulinaceae cyanobacterium SM2_1_0]|nr:metal-binding protein [Spirulinaceae cyanobacterium SM2_1_0]
MPSGRTHDRITLWSLPWVAGLALWLTRSSHFTAIIASGYLFSGLMFGPDLDIRSAQYKRWGWLRWLWLPYQKSLRHRSRWSHGLLLGTTLRIFYLLGILVIASLFTIVVVELLSDRPHDWLRLLLDFAQRLVHHRFEAIALFLGLEAGAMSHACADWLGSTWKRTKRQHRRPR